MMDFSKDFSVFISDQEFRKDIVEYLSKIKDKDRSIKLAMAGIYHVGIPGKRLKLNLKPEIYDVCLESNNTILIKNSKGKIKLCFSIYNKSVYFSYNYNYYVNNLIVASPNLLNECKEFYNNRLEDIISKLRQVTDDEIDKLSNLKV